MFTDSERSGTSLLDMPPGHLEGWSVKTRRLSCLINPFKNPAHPADPCRHPEEANMDGQDIQDREGGGAWAAEDWTMKDMKFMKDGLCGYAGLKSR